MRRTCRGLGGRPGDASFLVRGTRASSTKFRAAHLPGGATARGLGTTTLTTRTGGQHAVATLLAATAVGMGFGLGVYRFVRAEDGEREHEVSPAQLESGSVAATTYGSATFPIYRTRGDVMFWMQYYYKHPDSELIKLAVESLVKERMKPEDGWIVAGLLAGIIKNNPTSLSHYAIGAIFSALQDFRQALLVGLWLAGDNGREQLEKLAADVADEDIKATIAQLTSTAPPDPLNVDMDASNVSMNAHVLLGMFYATADEAVVRKLIDICKDWSVEVLSKGGKDGVARFYVAKAAREKLAMLCQEHDVARDICKRALEESTLTKEQRVMITNILEAVDRLTMDEQSKAAERKRRLDAAVDRALGSSSSQKS